MPSKASTSLAQTDKKKGCKAHGSASKGKNAHIRVYGDLADELRKFRLKIVQIKPDGNCFFRAVIDQTEVSFLHRNKRFLSLWSIFSLTSNHPRLFPENAGIIRGSHAAEAEGGQLHQAAQQ